MTDTVVVCTKIMTIIEHLLRPVIIIITIPIRLMVVCVCIANVFGRYSMANTFFVRKRNRNSEKWKHIQTIKCVRSEVKCLHSNYPFAQNQTPTNGQFNFRLYQYLGTHEKSGAHRTGSGAIHDVLAIRHWWLVDPAVHMCTPLTAAHIDKQKQTIEFAGIEHANYTRNVCTVTVYSSVNIDNNYFCQLASPDQNRNRSTYVFSLVRLCVCAWITDTHLQCLSLSFLIHG